MKVNVTLTMARITPRTTAVNRAQHRPSPGRPALPKNYQLVYEIVEEGGIGRHLSASQIYAKALKRRPGIGFSTVYRGLERLRDLGLVSELCVPGADAAAYEPAGPRHAHFRCSACGEIEDVPYAIPTRTLKALALQHGFNIESERVTFEGRCADCGAG
jgi:Fur family transcriptional regulator, ferric uptake regulator